MRPAAHHVGRAHDHRVHPLLSRPRRRARVSGKLADIGPECPKLGPDPSAVWSSWLPMRTPQAASRAATGAKRGVDRGPLACNWVNRRSCAPPVTGPPSTPARSVPGGPACRPQALHGGRWIVPHDIAQPVTGHEVSHSIDVCRSCGSRPANCNVHVGQAFRPRPASPGQRRGELRAAHAHLPQLQNWARTAVVIPAAPHSASRPANPAQGDRRPPRRGAMWRSNPSPCKIDDAGQDAPAERSISRPPPAAIRPRPATGPHGRSPRAAGHSPRLGAAEQDHASSR